MAQMLDNAKQKGGYHIYGSADKLRELKRAKSKGTELSEKEEKFSRNRINEKVRNSETGSIESTGGGDPLPKGSNQNEFLVASNTEEADIMRDKTNGDIAVRVQQDRNDDGTFSTDDRNDGKQNIGTGKDFYKITAPKSRDEWRQLAKKDPQEFSAAVELYLKRLEISVTREDFVDLSQKNDDKAGAKIRQIAIENNKKNLQKIRDLVAKSGNESALGKMDKSLRKHNEAVLKKMGFDPTEILGSNEQETTDNSTPNNVSKEDAAQNEYTPEEMEQARDEIYQRLNMPSLDKKNIRDQAVIDYLNSKKRKEN